MTKIPITTILVLDFYAHLHRIHFHPVLTRSLPSFNDSFTSFQFKRFLSYWE
jgi:hypothetical protein